MTAADVAWKARDSRIFAREQHDHYVEPFWVSERLFDVDRFGPHVWDPCCGWGCIVDAARKAGHNASGTDIVDRCNGRFEVADFREWDEGQCDIVCNPPFDQAKEFADRALKLSSKVAMIWLWRRLPAARWLANTPLARVWLMTPRPSMPSGEYIKNGGKVGGGTQDFCWLVWDRAHSGPPEMKWLHRDEGAL
jgi:hypothetical protein